MPTTTTTLETREQTAARRLRVHTPKWKPKLKYARHKITDKAFYHPGLNRHERRKLARTGSI